MSASPKPDGLGVASTSEGESKTDFVIDMPEEADVAMASNTQTLESTHEMDVSTETGEESFTEHQDFELHEIDESTSIDDDDADEAMDTEEPVRHFS